MNGAELIEAWRRRDELYSHWRGAMPPEMVSMIRAWRLQELNSLSPLDRGRVAIEVATWSPPVSEKRR